MPNVAKGDGMRGLAVFISDIRNCEYPPPLLLHTSTFLQIILSHISSLAQRSLQGRKVAELYVYGERMWRYHPVLVVGTLYTNVPQETEVVVFKGGGGRRLVDVMLTRPTLYFL
ncbi:AP-2 complex subunit alpha-1 [Branchiostoma belcheri]|nr:AP-2 complex subunit alpha-1 [Branchiostoma belcheri]